jgi:hypothetical protein
VLVHLDVMMKTVSDKVSTILSELPINDLQLYAELGNEAGKKGDLEESVSWYRKGLTKARQLKDSEKEKEFSNLIFTLL